MIASSASSSILKRHKKVLIILVAVLTIIIALGVSISAIPKLDKTEKSLQETANPPKVEITSTNLRAAPTEEHLAYVDVGLRNAGGAGTVIVSATISDGTDALTRNESIYIKSEESMDLTFTFSEVRFSNFSEVRAYTWISIPQTDSDKPST